MRLRHGGDEGSAWDCFGAADGDWVSEDLAAVDSGADAAGLVRFGECLLDTSCCIWCRLQPCCGCLPLGYSPSEGIVELKASVSCIYRELTLVLRNEYSHSRNINFPPLEIWSTRMRTWANSPENDHVKRQPCRAEPARLGILYGSCSLMRDGNQPHARETPWARWMDGWMLGMMGDAESQFAKLGELRLAVVMPMIPNVDHLLGPTCNGGILLCLGYGRWGGILRGDACVTRVSGASRK